MVRAGNRSGKPRQQIRREMAALKESRDHCGQALHDYSRSVRAADYIRRQVCPAAGNRMGDANFRRR